MMEVAKPTDQSDLVKTLEAGLTRLFQDEPVGDHELHGVLSNRTKPGAVEFWFMGPGRKPKKLIVDVGSSLGKTATLTVPMSDSGRQRETTGVPPTVDDVFDAARALLRE